MIDWGPFILFGIISSLSGSYALRVILSLLSLAWMIYNMGMLGGQTGVTYGRKWAGTKLINEDSGQPIGVGMAIARYFIHAIDAVICLVGFLFPLWTPKKQTISDMILKSIVIKTH